tara:strand:- start:700 stop:1299 length:600 start_codon:yes stop_codon:yes gene_type:complete
MARKIFIATIRDIGKRCLLWARENLTDELIIVENIEESEIIFSIIYDKIFDEKFLKNRKCFNFHCGILPYYGGSNASCWSIINREKEYGITLHEIDKGLDTGNIVEIRKFKISDTDTAHDLYTKGEDLIYQMFKDNFKNLIDGNYVSTKQDLRDTKIYYKREIENAKDLTRFIKAFYFPGKEPAYFFNRAGKKVYINYE